MKKKLVLLVVSVSLVLSSLSLTACGGSSSEAEATATETTAAEEPAAQDDTTEAAADTEEADTEEADNTDDEAEEVDAQEAEDAADEDAEEADDSEEAEEATDSEEVDVASYISEAYAGITENENIYAYLAFGDELGILMYYDTETNESGSFVGAYETDEENHAITITDEDLQASITFTCQESDGGYELDMGEDLGKAYVEEISVDDFAEAFTAISEGSEPQF